ncbi:glycoside hydrolase superfamily [Aspergillus karnatakaensis]|uniref:beta-glucosidase H n=1 Tax=Aspergillus karnatakaensis TaxID=1810916 RepID=UPI003CCD822A
MADLNVEETLRRLSLDDKVALLSGIDFWHPAPLPADNVPSIRLSDGPNGLRGTKFFNSVPAACFPCGTALGATFNQDLLCAAGQKMAEEAFAKNLHVILGPTINMQRSPLGGRGFESIGEDPFLAGLSMGIQATINHFVCNEHEHKRNGVQAIVTERALREIYALPFQIVVRDAHPGAFMMAYNAVNGTFCSENHKLIQELLRGDTVEAVKAGLDLEMPGPPAFRGNLLKFAVIGVREVLRFVKKCAGAGIVEHGPEGVNDTEETAALLRRIGNESIVLLKNEGVLPLKKEKKTLVIGPNAKVATYCGGGSASLNPYYIVTPYDGISAKLDSGPSFSIGAYTHKLLPLLGSWMQPRGGKPGMSWKLYNEAPGTVRQTIDELWLTSTKIYLADYKNSELQELWYADLEGNFIADQDGAYEFGLVVCGTAKLYIDGQLLVDNAAKQTLGDAFYGCGTIEERGRIGLRKGQSYHIKVEFASAPSFTLKPNNIMVGGGSLRFDWETESSDRTSMKLPGVLDQLISEVALANSNTVVVMQTGTHEEMPWLSTTKAVIQAWYGGNETGNSIADVLFGDYNPSGKLSLSSPKRLQDVPSFLNFRTDAGRTLYGEDVYLGYRYYELAETEVNFHLDIRVKEGTVRASFKVQNTGSLKGAEVAQLYVQPLQPAKVNRPIKELKGFAKVELEAGESKEVVITVEEKYAAAYFDEERDQWCVEAGVYKVIISDSSAITSAASIISLEYSVQKSD